MTSPTLKKIAETLGLSVSTVSRAMKSHPDISALTRQKVMDLAKSLDYEPNANAVHLRTKNSRLLGVLVPSISNFFYDSFIAAIEEEGRRNGYAIMILQSGNQPAIEMENLKLFRQNRITGLFAAITSHTDDLSGFDKLGDMDTPVIFFDVVPEKTGIHTVCQGDTQAGQMAAATILQKKKKKVFALFGDQHLSITHKRFDAFMQTFKQDAPSIPITTAHASSSEEAKKMTEQIINSVKKPDTIFCMSDEILIGVLKALQENKIRIPEEIGVIAISNGFIPKLFHPEITYIETSGHALGKLAFTHMMHCLQAKQEPAAIILEAVLVEGGSL